MLNSGLELRKRVVLRSWLVLKVGPLLAKLATGGR